MIMIIVILMPTSKMCYLMCIRVFSVYQHNCSRKLALICVLRAMNETYCWMCICESVCLIQVDLPPLTHPPLLSRLGLMVLLLVTFFSLSCSNFYYCHYYCYYYHFVAGIITIIVIIIFIIIITYLIIILDSSFLSSVFFL